MHARFPFRAALAATILALAAGSLRAQPYVPGPHPDWERRPPAEAGLDPDALAAAIDFAIDNESSEPRDLELAHYLGGFGEEPYSETVGPFRTRGDPTGVIVRGGYIVAEWGDPDRVDMTFSVTKSFLSSVVGLAWDAGRIADLDDPVRLYAPDSLFATDHNAAITWDHLLRQTSDWEGALWGKPDWADRPRGEPGTWTSRPRDPPGTAWKYNDVRVNLLALAALPVWREPLQKVLRERLMEPIGASTTWRWHGYENSWVTLDGLRMESPSGGGHWGGGMFISAHDQARFGLLTLLRGVWGERRILSEAWVERALTPTDPQPTYGFMNWFLNTDRALLPGAPESAFAHLGAGTNAVVVLPEQDLVVVARWIRRDAIDGLVERVLAAVVE